MMYLSCITEMMYSKMMYPSCISEKIFSTTIRKKLITSSTISAIIIPILPTMYENVILITNDNKFRSIVRKYSMLLFLWLSLTVFNSEVMR